jgi:DNA-binding NarL/FixJ family response regulator
MLVVDDHDAFRQALSMVLEREEGLTVVGQAGSLAEARAMLDGVDVAIVDLELRDGDGLDLVPDLHRASPQAAVLVLTGSDDQPTRARAVELGAAGVLHKSAHLEEIMDAVRRLGEGEAIMAPQEVVELWRVAMRQRKREQEAEAVRARLTPREFEVLQALARGLGDRQMAEELHVSIETVRTHMVNILGKFGVHSRVQALLFAIRHRLVDVR